MRKLGGKFIMMLSMILSLTFVSCEPLIYSLDDYDYVVEGNGRAYNVSFTDINDNIIRYENVRSGVVYSFQQYGIRQMTFSAQGIDSAAEITIYRNGKAIAQKMSIGAGSVVTISAKI